MRIQSPNESRRRACSLLAIALVSLATLGGCGAPAGTGSRLASVDPDLVLADGWPDPQMASEPLLPWSLEAQADIVAVARVRQPAELRSRSIIELELTEFLKGQTAAESVFPEDTQAFLGCIPPKTIARPSELFPPGSQALAYLTRTEDGGLSILQLTQAPSSGRLDAIRRFVATESALSAPAPDWDTLLPPDGTLDDVTHWALIHVRPAGAATPLRAMLTHTLDRAEAGERPDAAHLNLVAGHLSGSDAEPASLPLLRRLARWIVGLEDETSYRAHWPVCSPGRLLAHVPAETVPQWESLLRRLLARSGANRSGVNEYAVQGTANALAQLPGGAGVPALIEALDGRRPVVASALTVWARDNPSDTEHRAAVRRRANALRAEAGAAGDDQLTLRRHLDALIDALGGYAR